VKASDAASNNATKTVYFTINISLPDGYVKSVPSNTGAALRSSPSTDMTQQSNSKQGYQDLIFGSGTGSGLASQLGVNLSASNVAAQRLEEMNRDTSERIIRNRDPELVETDPPPPNRVPAEGATGQRLRIPARGRLEQLGQDFAYGRRPTMARHQGYAVPVETEPEAIGSLFDPAILVLARESGTGVGLEHALRVTATLRNTVMQHCPEPVPEWVSGHDRSGGPTRAPHLAFVPLADVGHAYSDGHLLGAALVMPREVEPGEAERCLAPLLARAHGESIRLYDGRAFEWSVLAESRLSPPVALRPSTWTRAARRWATVTPMAFDRHRKKTHDTAAHDQETVARACRAIGLPEPARVVTSPVSRIRGVPHVRDFPALRRHADGGRIHMGHLLVEFAEPVVGPILLGAGRFRGYGMCRPLAEPNTASREEA